MTAYYCANCQKEVPAEEVVQVGGLMHKTCRSGRVTPVVDPPK